MAAPQKEISRQEDNVTDASRAGLMASASDSASAQFSSLIDPAGNKAEDSNSTAVQNDGIDDKAQGPMEISDDMLTSASTDDSSSVSSRATDTISDAALSPSGPMSGKGKDEDTLTLVTWLGNVSPAKKKWSFPWALCQTWEGMYDQIKGAFAQNPAAMVIIEADHFELKDKDGRIITSTAWKDLAKPNWEVSITFSVPWAIEPPASRRPGGGRRRRKRRRIEKSKEDSVKPPVEVKIGYSVQVFEELSYGSGREYFRYQKYYTHPNVVVPRGGRARPVLQETTEVARPGGVSRIRDEDSDEEDQVDPEPERLDPTDRIMRKSLTINSSELLDALRSVVKYTSQSPTRGDDSLARGIFPAPFEDLYLHRNDLRQFRDQENETRRRHSAEYNAKCDRHIGYLLEWLTEKERSRTDDAEGPIDGKAATITFNSFWQILKPGCDVFIRENGKVGLYVVESVTGGIIDKRAEAYKIHVWNLRFDGQYIGRKLRVLTIPPWEGARDLKTLPIFPTYVYQDKNGSSSIEQDLKERGKKYFNFTKKPKYQEFTGWTMRRARKHEKTRVIIITDKEMIKRDAKYFLDSWESLEPDQKIQPGLHARAAACQCETCEQHYAAQSHYAPVTFASYDKIRPSETTELTDHQYKLCTGLVTAYILKDRNYELIDIEDVSDPRINVGAIDKLVINPESNKAMIKAIGEAYMNAEGGIKPFFADAIRGKGEGQIILLHGPPGTGKTLTAESVAEFTRRPLLSITAADLGHNPMQLEQNLLTFFANAQDWDAIVLLDEADVYMESRQVRDIERNGIVSVFLRTLEYFHGIMFLTTNRVGSFDEAFLSRIHVQIAYEPLNQDSRVKIWKNTFKKLEEDHEEGGQEIRYEYRAEQFVCESSNVRDLEWNGREIRNAFQTAVALAVYEAKGEVPKIKEEHFEQVVAMSKKFKEYMRSTRQRDDATLAFQRSLRDDAFGREPHAQPTSGWAARTANR